MALELLADYQSDLLLGNVLALVVYILYALNDLYLQMQGQGRD